MRQGTLGYWVALGPAIDNQIIDSDYGIAAMIRILLSG